MDPILKSLLDNISNGVTRKLIGQNICDAIISYAFNSDNVKIDYSEVLYSKYGNHILLDSSVFRSLILFLPATTIYKIADEARLAYQNDEDARHLIIERGFGLHNYNWSTLVLSTLGLSVDDYLPETEVQDETYQNIIEPSYGLHKYQKNIKDKAVQYLLSVEHSNRLLIHMPTGAGKTKTAMEILCDYLRSRGILGGFDKSAFVVWLAHSKELCDQAFDTFSYTWKLRGDVEINAFKLYGDYGFDDKIIESNNAVLFIGFQKFNALLNSKNPKNRALRKAIVDNVKLVVVDEAHKSLATTYEKTINTLTESYAGVQLVGLTATPGRTASHQDFENDMLAHFYNSTKIGLIDEYGIEIKDPIRYLQNLGVLAEIEREELMTDIQVQLAEQELKDLRIFGDDKLEKILNDLSVHPGRNKLIIEKVKGLFEQGDSILIFACGVEHCVILQSLLTYNGVESQIILGSSSKRERENNIRRFKAGDLKILINYGVLSTGFDAPNLNALIITRPTTSLVLYSQMVGRALRGPLNGGNKKNKLIDLKDNWNLGSESIMFDFYNNLWI